MPVPAPGSTGPVPSAFVSHICAHFHFAGYLSGFVKLSGPQSRIGLPPVGVPDSAAARCEFLRSAASPRANCVLRSLAEPELVELIGDDPAPLDLEQQESASPGSSFGT
jgi:hypothetical protein